MRGLNFQGIEQRNDISLPCTTRQITLALAVHWVFVLFYMFNGFRILVSFGIPPPNLSQGQGILRLASTDILDSDMLGLPGAERLADAVKSV